MKKVSSFYIIISILSFINKTYSHGKVKCSVSYCSICSATTDDVCIRCMENYVLRNGTCYSTDCSHGCEICDRTKSYVYGGGNCINCKPSFFMNENNKFCSYCSNTCASCSNYDKCTSCYPYSTLKDGKCIPSKPNISNNNCLDYDCKACDKKTNECLTCGYDYKLIEGTCYPKNMNVTTTLTTSKCPSEGCQVCNRANNTQCLNCKIGYFLGGQGSCVIPSSEIISKDCYTGAGCSTCFTFKKDYCLSCLSGWNLLGFNCYNKNERISYTCASSANCASCVSKYLYQCIACMQGYYFNGFSCEKLSSYDRDSYTKVVSYILVGIFVPITVIIVVVVLVITLKKKEDQSKIFEDSGKYGNGKQMSDKNVYVEIFRNTNQANEERQIK